MSLTSLEFGIFVIVILFGYYLIPMKFRWIWLLAGSAYFYISYDLKLSVWLLISILLIYLAGLWLDKCNQKYEKLMELAEKKEKKELKKRCKNEKSHIVLLFAVINIGIWIYFKFTDTILQTLNQFSAGNFEMLNLVAPLGISFYILQAISYVVDIKRGKCQPQKNLFKLALWLGFFPQMIQGPVSRYTETSEQLFKGNPLEIKNIKFGAQLALWGYFKKLIIANYSAVMVNTIFGNAIGKYAGCEYIVGIVLYAVQIYCDFSGGIDIISGIAEMLGIFLPVNFSRPYFSRGIQEYWRRWHITLGSWFRDYIFYPLSISTLANKMAKHTRKIFGIKLGNMIPTYIALIIVWTSNGIWHGAGLRYFMYGFYNGILITVGMQFGGIASDFADHTLKLNRECFSWKLFQMLRTFSLVCFGRILFKADTVTDAFQIYKSIFTKFNPWILFDGSIYTYGLSEKQVRVLAAAILVLLIVSIIQESGIKIREKIAEQNIVFRWGVCYAAIFVVLIFGMYGTGFSAGDFIYMKY